ncbi:hypothetical protein GCM10022243_45940 [Saccharothrix violaceirubra]|uniref:Uncharacterized protein n=1 Tax=Saccharothrix violaceirubra TaxID=413306 RepID=A0A7W7WUW6_9PSEU|nr:hypothetical protein [Saccharothrix violaceirubra]MBB4964516.1 hypothetical protein [Saccharothrix violaceirubra]
MSNAAHDEPAIWSEDRDGEHPAGEMSVSGRSRTGARARALAGLTLAVGAYAVVAAGVVESTSVSAPTLLLG